MSKIVLKRANVVKCVDSEDRALALELKGFVRADGKSSFCEDANEKLAEASKHAEEADKKIAELEAELSGTKEQLEAAVKKNKAADKK